MTYQRGDIVELPLILPPDNKVKPHPVVIISNEDVHEGDDCYIGVMLTHSKEIDVFTFELSNEMFVKFNSDKYAQARCHLVTYFLKSHITADYKNRMKENSVNQLAEHVFNSALSKF
jgi:hypothetical protein